jgi:predicted DCC family thiol-disulfide oxidoreductase YuxK
VFVGKETMATIYFDGICNLCNGFVQFVIKRDPTARLHFAALQSEAGQNMLSEYNKSTEELDSIVYVKDGKMYQKSEAVLNVLRELGGFWGLLYGFIIIPRFISDAVYDLVASNRYRMFGKLDSCMMPTPELKSRFLD